MLTAHVKATVVNGVPVALLTTEKIGEYESGAVEQDLTALAAQHRYRYAVDFSQVRLLSSVGIGLLIKLHRVAAANKGKVAYFGMDTNLMGLLKMTKLDKGLPIAKDQAAAVAMVQ